MKNSEADFFSTWLRRHNSELHILRADSVDALKRQIRKIPSDAARRLIAFSTQIIVPCDVLAFFGQESFNFHPGPPERPGSRPSAFAFYEKDISYGVTLHRMIEKVDAGPIIKIQRFVIESSLHHATMLAMRAYKEMALLFVNESKNFSDLSYQFPVTKQTWSGPKRTLADYEALRIIRPFFCEAEIIKRFYAADGIYCPLEDAPSLA